MQGTVSCLDASHQDVVWRLMELLEREACLLQRVGRDVQEIASRQSQARGQGHSERRHCPIVALFEGRCAERQFPQCAVRQRAVGGRGDLWLIDSRHRAFVNLHADIPEHNRDSVLRDDGDRVLLAVYGQSGKVEDKGKRLLLRLVESVDEILPFLDLVGEVRRIHHVPSVEVWP